MRVRVIQAAHWLQKMLKHWLALSAGVLAVPLKPSQVSSFCRIQQVICAESTYDCALTNPFFHLFFKAYTQTLQMQQVGSRPRYARTAITPRMLVSRVPVMAEVVLPQFLLRTHPRIQILTRPLQIRPPRSRPPRSRPLPLRAETTRNAPKEKLRESARRFRDASGKSGLAKHVLQKAIIPVVVVVVVEEEEAAVATTTSHKAIRPFPGGTMGMMIGGGRGGN